MASWGLFRVVFGRGVGVVVAAVTRTEKGAGVQKREGGTTSAVSGISHRSACPDIPGRVVRTGRGCDALLQNCRA